MTIVAFISGGRIVPGTVVLLRTKEGNVSFETVRVMDGVALGNAFYGDPQERPARLLFVNNDDRRIPPRLELELL